MKKLFGVLLIAVLFAVVGCTENQRARTWGGSAKVDLPVGQKLTVATWKQDSLWYLTRPMRQGEVPETHEFIESSSFGLIEGKVIFVEHR